MTGEWKLIAQGFAIAAMGATASMLFIVGVSAAYVGKFNVSIASVVVAGGLAIAFRTYLQPFLDLLDRRQTESVCQVAPEGGEEGASNPNHR